MEKTNKNWEEEFERTEYNKLAFIGNGAEKWKKSHNEKIRQLLSQSRTQTIEEIKGKIEKDFKKWFYNSVIPIEDWMEKELTSLK